MLCCPKPVIGRTVYLPSRSGSEEDSNDLPYKDTEAGQDA